MDYSDQTWYAVKALGKMGTDEAPLNRRQRNFQSREIQLYYKALTYPNIVSMFKVVDDPVCAYDVLEYCQDGDIFSNITEIGRYVGNYYLIRATFLQLFSAVQHCHKLGIYHRDLNPETIVVDGMQVLLADFSLATTDA